MSQMRALCYDRTGPAAEVLGLRMLARPEPGPGEVLVQVAVSGANPSDAKTRAGARAPIPFPLVIPNSDGAGRIVAIGERRGPAPEAQALYEDLTPPEERDKPVERAGERPTKKDRRALDAFRQIDEE